MPRGRKPGERPTAHTFNTMRVYISRAADEDHRWSRHLASDFDPIQRALDVINEHYVGDALTPDELESLVKRYARRLNQFRHYTGEKKIYTVADLKSNIPICVREGHCRCMLDRPCCVCGAPLDGGEENDD